MPDPGRPFQYGEKKQTLCLRVSPVLRDYLDEIKGDDSLSVTVEEIIRRSEPFKLWKILSEKSKEKES